MNAENQLVGGMLNPKGIEWTAAYWMEDEPSFVSEEENEMFMNHEPMDITQYYLGKTGYICEMDE